MIAVDRFSPVRQEQRAVVRVGGQLQSRFADVFFNPRRRALADRHEAVFLALALAHQQRAALAVQIEQFQADQFHAPDARRIKHFQDGTVAQPEGSAMLGCIITCSASEAVSTWRGRRWPRRGNSISEAGSKITADT
ncbi:MAG: hypothetical protein WAN23_14555 [Candidatus Acidiferrales bacterium]